MQFRTRRRKTNFEVLIDSHGGELRATIVDVTERGGRLRLLTGHLAPNNSIALKIRGEDIAAQVVWAKAGEVGIAFDQILPLDVLATINQTMRSTATSKVTRFQMG
ncbi:MAG: PilZ domain-containing protein [Pseudomonadota bacterium]